MTNHNTPLNLEFGLVVYSDMHPATLRHIEIKLVDRIMSLPGVVNDTQREKLEKLYQHHLYEVTRTRKTKEV